MRDGDWKMIVKEDRVQLYDLSKDIGETTNLAEQFPDRTASMRAENERWKAETIWNRRRRTP